MPNDAPSPESTSMDSTSHESAPGTLPSESFSLSHANSSSSSNRRSPSSYHHHQHFANSSRKRPRTTIYSSTGRVHTPRSLHPSLYPDTSATASSSIIEQKHTRAGRAARQTHIHPHVHGGALPNVHASSLGRQSSSFPTSQTSSASTPLGTRTELALSQVHSAVPSAPALAPHAAHHLSNSLSHGTTSAARAFQHATAPPPGTRYFYSLSQQSQLEHAQSRAAVIYHEQQRLKREKARMLQARRLSQRMSVRARRGPHPNTILVIPPPTNGGGAATSGAAATHAAAETI